MSVPPVPRRGRPGAPGRRVAAIASITLHAVVLGVLALRIAAIDAPRPVDGVLAHVVLPAGSLLPAPDGDGPLSPRKVSSGRRVFPIGCRGEVYTGIGALVNSAGFILDLAPDGPAERAGLRAGDAILNLEDLPIDVYPAGQSVDVRLLRDGFERPTTVRIGPICNEPAAALA